MLDCRLQDSNRLQQLNISASNIQLLSSNIQLPYAANTTAACNTFKYFCLQYTAISQPSAMPNIWRAVCHTKMMQKYLSSTSPVHKMA
jgi:hypothetical protein